MKKTQSLEGNAEWLERNSFKDEKFSFPPKTIKLDEIHQDPVQQPVYITKIFNIISLSI